MVHPNLTHCCHKIHGKRVSDTVFFKHKYITQPTLTLADILTKAIDDLAHALKGRRNTKGIMELEALQKLDELLNQAPQAQTPPPRQIPGKKQQLQGWPTQSPHQLQRWTQPSHTKSRKKCHRREPKCATLYTKQQTAEPEFPKDIK